MITLDELPRRVRAVVVAVAGDGSGHRWLLELGVTEGVEVTRELTGALGEPGAYRVRGGLVALRRAQARTVTVRILEDAG